MAIAQQNLPLKIGVGVQKPYAFCGLGAMFRGDEGESETTLNFMLCIQRLS